jgi:protein phosphatase
MVQGAAAVVAHVGDSRIYRFRCGVLRCMTSDHTLVASMEADGLDCASALSCFSHVVTRAIGVPGDAEPDVATIDVRPGDRFLLCTDGLTDTLAPLRIGRILETLPPADASESLVDEALRARAQDNVTALVVEISADS